VYLVYMDDSGDERAHIFAALAVPAEHWHTTFEAVRGFRRGLAATYGVGVHYELHAWKLVSGRGAISERVVTKYERACIFRDAMDLVASLPGLRVLSSCFPAGQDLRAFERLMCAMNQCLRDWGRYAVVVSDEGKEAGYTRLARRMALYDPVAAHQASLGGQTAPAAAMVERIVEDPFFKKSDHSYLIQLADLVAYALLRQERPLGSKVRYGLHTAFARLGGVLAMEANPMDPCGTVRP
jgi:hypothetical protein